VEAPSAAAGSASNRYEILARLATGGMAELYLARATAADGQVSHVVLKRVLPSRAHDPNFVTMFVDEARLAAQLHHPNIAQVFDIGRLGSSYFFTMEYVHGENARAVLQREYGLRRKVPVSHAITIAVGAATGLHHAHEAIGPDGRKLGVVHRDVSPANIMISFDGAVKLVDFGVAKAAVRFHETRSGTIKGKIAYLSPEQCTGNKPVDRRSDVFSLGIVLYELLTVERLFRRDSDFATMAAIVTDDVLPPSSIRREVPPGLDAVVMTALSKNPEERYASAGEMVDALEHAARTAGIALSVGGLGRYLRELFGVRPEPWIELESIEQNPAPVTVTGESMIQMPAATPIGPGSEQWARDQLVPTPPIAEVAEVEAALIRTVQLEAVPPLDDDEFLAKRDPSKPSPQARGKAGSRPAADDDDEAIEDRPTVIDDRMPEMPLDLDLTTPLEPMTPVPLPTPPTSVRALPPRPTPPTGTPGASARTPNRPGIGPDGPAAPSQGAQGTPGPSVATTVGRPPTGGSKPPPVPPTPPQGAVIPKPPILPQYLVPQGVPATTPPAPQHTPPMAPLDDDDDEPATATMPAYRGEADDDQPWSKDTSVEPPTAVNAEPPTMRQPAVMPHVPMGTPPMMPVAAPPAVEPRIKLRTKLVLAGIGVIVASLIIRAATHHGKPAAAGQPPAPTQPKGPSLPPADK
jgi:serine/threonine protein kinase